LLESPAPISAAEAATSENGTLFAALEALLHPKSEFFPAYAVPFYGAFSNLPVLLPRPH
jgi:hypothetical protein